VFEPAQPMAPTNMASSSGSASFREGEPMVPARSQTEQGLATFRRWFAKLDVMMLPRENDQMWIRPIPDKVFLKRRLVQTSTPCSGPGGITRSVCTTRRMQPSLARRLADSLETPSWCLPQSRTALPKSVVFC
jgi:hypothetical protein